MMARYFVLVLFALSVYADEHPKMRRAGADRIPEEYIVVLADDVSPDKVPDVVLQLATAHGANVENIWSSAIRGFFARMTEAQAEAMSHHPFVAYVEENAPWYQSATQRTNIDPRTCDPTTTNCPAVVDDRLWHLDRSDQAGAVPNETYAYCTDGTGVTVYVVDSGVNKFHNEFGPTGSRVRIGYNATPDMMPANDPCLGFAEVADATGARQGDEATDYGLEILGSGHGTGVASALAGRRVGVAKNATIVPIKVIRCDSSAAREWNPSRTYYRYETAYRRTESTRGQIYRVAGFVVASATSGVSGTTFPAVGHKPNRDGQRGHMGEDTCRIDREHRLPHRRS